MVVAGAAVRQNTWGGSREGRASVPVEKFPEEVVIFLGSRAGWIMDREWADAIEADAQCRIGAEKWGQHQLRHRDRTSPGLCKVLHIEKSGQNLGPRCS